MKCSPLMYTEKARGILEDDYDDPPALRSVNEKILKYKPRFHDLSAEEHAELKELQAQKIELEKLHPREVALKKAEKELIDFLCEEHKNVCPKRAIKLLVNNLHLFDGNKDYGSTPEKNLDFMLHELGYNQLKIVEAESPA